MQRSSFTPSTFLPSVSIVLSLAAIGLVLFKSGDSRLDKVTGASSRGQLDLVERVSELEKRLLLLEGVTGDKEGLIARSSSGENIDIEATIDDRIASVEKKYQERLDSKIKSRMDKVSNRHRNEHGEWSPKLGELTEELSLDTEQVETTTDILDSAKDDLLSIFQTPQENGGSLLDDMIEDIQAGVEPAIAQKEFVQRMWEENVPGTDRSYITDIIALRNEVFSSLGENMDSQQKSKMESLRIDPLDVKTGYDPIKEYVESQLER